jgi:hypothetical protein
MQKAVNMGVMRIGHVTLEKVSKLLLRRWEIDDVDTARKVVLVHASNLRYMMDHPRKRGASTEYFVAEPIYKELSAGHNMPAAEIRRIESIELKPRKDHSSLREDADSDSDSDSDAHSTIETPKAQQRPRHRKKGRLSVLRPKSSEFSGKGKSVNRPKGKGKAPRANISSGSEDEGGGAPDPDEDDPVIDTPTQAFSPGKRKLDAEDLIATIKPRKRAASESASVLSAEQDTTSESEDPETSTERLPLQWRARNRTSKSSTTAILPPVVTTPLPTFTANGPGDSWTCTFDGCTQKVYGASTDLGRSLIEEHMQDHARGRIKEVSLVLKEEKRLRLPVKYVMPHFTLLIKSSVILTRNSNLIKRIREMSELQQNLFPSGPSSPALSASAAVPAAAPAPIQRI